MKAVEKAVRSLLALAAAASVSNAWANPLAKNYELDVQRQLSENRSASSEGGRTRGGRNSADVEEVIVTAQRREERLQDVPISISVLDGQGLEGGTIASLKDALRTVPGVAGYENNQAAGMTKFSVRGVTSNQSIFNGSSTVGYYLDEIPFAFVRFPISPDTNAYDLKQVEVLRGPQGTLYGASSLNGVVRVITQDADLNDFSFKSRASFSSTENGGDNYRVDGAVGVPLIPGKLAIRAVGGYSDYGGWVDFPRIGVKDGNVGVQKSLRLKVNAAPTENFTVEMLSWQSRDDRDAGSGSLDDQTSRSPFLGNLSSNFDAYNLTLGYDFESFTLLSSTSSLKFDGSSRVDISGVDVLLTEMESEMVSQEVRLNSSSDGAWTWSIGGIYRDSKDTRFQDFLRNVGGANNLLHHYTSESFALFGEFGRKFLDDRLELLTGLRYFDDSNDSNELSPFTTDVPFGIKRETFSATTPRVVLTYHPTQESSIYASYSQGFRSGFAQEGAVLRVSRGLATAVEPDRLSNYEIGVKASAFDSRINYEVAVYYIDWKDPVQVSVITVGDPPVSFSAAINSSTINGVGTDIGMSWQVTDRFSLGLTGSWNDLKFSEDVFSGSGVLFPEGQRPPESPEITAGANINYHFPIGGLTGRLSGAANYVSRLYIPIGGLPNYGDNLLLARSSFTVDSPSGWSAMFFVDNLTNEEGQIRNTDPVNNLADRFRPRTIGLQVEYRFD